MDVGVVETMVKRVLMIAFHFPPFVGSSGLQRTLQFANHLSHSGWEPLVLTARPSAYKNTNDDQLDEIDDNVRVIRTMAFDASRHFSIAGRYPSFLANPDPWSSWYYSSMRAALSLIRKFRVDIIWSTYPIATAHKIGLELARATEIPWVADFRDMMIDDDYPTDLRKRRIYSDLEAEVVRTARKVLVTTQGTLDLYSRRYSAEDPAKWVEIRNGYHEGDFASVTINQPRKKNDQMRLVHSGLLYPSERDPRPFYRAVSELKAEGVVSAASLNIAFRATGHDQYHAALLHQHGIEDIVVLLPGIGHKQAIEEMVQADGLLIFQAANCNNQIPAKIYEYFRSQRPILGITDPSGDTALTMTEAGLDDIVDIADIGSIKIGLKKFIDSMVNGTAKIVDLERVNRFSRQSQAEELKTVFESICGND